jgi:hypothetical protein
LIACSSCEYSVNGDDSLSGEVRAADSGFGATQPAAHAAMSGTQIQRRTMRGTLRS